MTEHSAAPGPVRFGPFELDSRAGELRRNGSRVNLAEQPLKFLLALLDRPGQLVSRDELRQRLWPDDTFVDFEHGLNAAVKRLRDALGDSADTPRYIETVPRRGYRFIANIDAASGVTASERQERPLTASLPGLAQPPAAAHSGWWKRSRLLLAFGVLTATAAVGWYAVRPHTADRVGVSARELTRVTFDRGLQTDVTWSPDGQRIAYASEKAGNFDIWVQTLGGGDPISVTSSPAADTQPAWSPTSDQIVFRSEREGGGLFVVSTAGGPERRLTTFGAFPFWLPDGREIVFRPSVSGSGENLYVVSSSGDGAPREILSEFLRGGWWGWTAPHPDGRLTVIGAHRTHLFGAFTIGTDGQDLVIVKPPGKLLQALGWGDPLPKRRFHWNPAGTALYVEVPSNEIPSLWKIRVAADTLEWLSAERLTTGSGNATAAAVSPDGERLAFTSSREIVRAWVFPFDAITGRVEGQGRPVTDEETQITRLRLSPDGQSLLYNGHRAGTTSLNILSTDLETGKTSVLVPNARGPIPSADGTRICYLLSRPPSGRSEGTTESDLEFALAVRDASGSERLVRRWASIGGRLNPTDWAPDGQGILGSYWAPGDIGPVVLAVWPVSQGIADKPSRILLRAPGQRFWQGRFSPDGRWISFVVEGASKLGQLAMGIVRAERAPEGKWTRIASDHEWPDKPRWAPDGKTLYFISREPVGNFNVWGVRLDPLHGRPVGEPFQITHFDEPDLMIDPDVGFAEMDITGKHLALTMRSVTGSIWMLSGVDR